MSGKPVRVYNSLGRTMTELSEMVPGTVRLYSCGMTVYADPHLGNMRPYVFSDELRRMLEWKGYAVQQIVNITDVGHAVGDGDLGEDKVEVAAREQEASVWEVTRKYTDIFFADLAMLNVLKHTANPRASEYVPQMIEFAKVLEAKGFTYQLDSGLYFDTSRSAGYGFLAQSSIEGQQRTERMEELLGKRNPADFALWRAERPGRARLVHWDSPWGPGVPGWHLECSVMSMELLGEHFDLHTGGVDHREIHHVNEIAQSEAYLGDGIPWVPYWMHNEFLLTGNEKMAKSKGRMPVLRDLVAEGFHPLAYRYFLLLAHYRKQVDFSLEGVRAAAGAYRRLLLRVAHLRPLPPVPPLADLLQHPSSALREVAAAMDDAISDDLNTPRVLAELNRVVRSEALTDEEKALAVSAADHLLGLALGDTDAAHAGLGGGEAGAELDAGRIEHLMDLRQEARAVRNFAESDRLRDELAQLGVQVHDEASGSTWEYVGTALT